MKEFAARVLGIALLGAIQIVNVAPAFAAGEWPSKPVKIVVGNPPAGSADRFGRLLASALSTSFKEQFYVENKPGNSGSIAALQVAHAEPNGYTLMVGASGPHVSAPLFTDVGYDPVADFTHIAMIGGDTYILATNPELGVKSLAELLALARSRKEPITCATPGVNSLGYIVFEQFRRAAGIDVLYVPYRGGGTATVDVLGNHVSMAILPVANFGPLIRGNLVTPLAVASAERNPAFPDIPTFAELGYPKTVAETWFWLAGPKNIPEPIVTKLNAETQKSLKRPEIVKQYKSEASIVKNLDANAMNHFVADELVRWRATMKEIGLQPR